MYIEDVWCLITFYCGQMAYSYIPMLLHTTPTHRTPVKWNQSNFVSDQNPSPCLAFLEFKHYNGCLQKRPGKDPWLLVVEIGFWAIEKLWIFTIVKMKNEVWYVWGQILTKSWPVFFGGRFRSRGLCQIKWTFQRSSRDFLHGPDKNLNNWKRDYPAQW